MFIERLEVTGLRGLDATPRALARTETLHLPWAPARAFRDAVLLPFCVVDAEALRCLLAGWGAEQIEVRGAPLLEGASWSGAPGLDAWFDPAAEGLVRVRVRLQLDPPQFAALRSAALRDTRLVDALAGGATIDLAVGLRFAPGYDTLAVDLLSFVLGEVPFPTSGPDRPAWLVPLLEGLRGKVRTTPLAPAAWGEAAASWSAEVQTRLRDTLAALAAPPAELTGLVALPGEPALLDGDRLVPMRLLAPEAQAMIGWVGAARLARPDVLVVAGGPPGRDWARWWAAQVTDDGAPLEQIILLEAPRGGTGRP